MPKRRRNFAGNSSHSKRASWWNWEFYDQDFGRWMRLTQPPDTSRERAYTAVAFMAIALSTLALTSVGISLPLFYAHVQSVHTRARLGRIFCHGTVDDLLHLVHDEKRRNIEIRLQRKAMQNVTIAAHAKRRQEAEQQLKQCQCESADPGPPGLPGRPGKPGKPGSPGRPGPPGPWAQAACVQLMTLLPCDPKLDPRLDLNLDPKLDPNLDPNLDPKLDPKLDQKLDYKLDSKLDSASSTTERASQSLNKTITGNGDVQSIQVDTGQKDEESESASNKNVPTTKEKTTDSMKQNESPLRDISDCMLDAEIFYENLLKNVDTIRLCA